MIHNGQSGDAHRLEQFPAYDHQIRIFSESISDIQGGSSAEEEGDPEIRPDHIVEKSLHDGSTLRILTWSNHRGLCCDRCDVCTYERTSESSGVCYEVDTSTISPAALARSILKNKRAQNASPGDVRPTRRQ